MSKIGRLPIAKPPDVSVAIAKAEVEVKGPLGTLRGCIPVPIVVEDQGECLVVKRPSDNRHHRALHGLTAALLRNMVKGVSQGFEKVLEVNGVGYRAAASGQELTLNLGYSHPIKYRVEEGVKVEVERNLIRVKGIDKQRVGQVAAEIRFFRPPEPYKGKGIRYQDEFVRHKVGKRNI